jgi:hypothetical protein
MLSEAVARFIGGFYVFGGLMTLWAARQDYVMNQILERVEAKPLNGAEWVRTASMALIGGLTLISGLLLIGLRLWSAPVFVACTAFQAMYLIWASGTLPPENEAERFGRRRTLNSFFVYLAATAYVVSLRYQGVLI